MLQNISNLGVGIILAFFYGWSLTLVTLAFIPFMIIAGFLQTYLLTGFANRVYFKRISVVSLCFVSRRINKLWKMLERCEI
jgi:hypothetical protein